MRTELPVQSTARRQAVGKSFLSIGSLAVMSIRSPTFIAAQATRSRVADLLYPRGEGRSAFCNALGVTVKVRGSQRVLTYDQLADVDTFYGWFWGTVTVVTTDGEVVKVSGLPKPNARTLAQALAHNQIINVRNVTAGLAKGLEAADAELSKLTVGGRYVAAHMMRSWLVMAEELAPLVGLRIKPGMLPPDIESRIGRLTHFLANHERYRVALNKRFVEAELIKMKTFLGSIENKPLTLSQSRAVVTDEDRNLVIAGAGSGKTSVIVAKVAYLVRKGHRRPDEILVMAYGKHASMEIADRLRERLGVSVAVKTFHKLGLTIIANVDRKPPSLSPFAEDEKKLQTCIHRIVQNLLAKDHGFAEVFLEWFRSYFAHYKSHWEFRSWGQYWQYVRDHEVRTLKGEKVKSYEECEIANWLYLSGIKYEYEPNYEYDVATPERRQYKPDFYLPDLRVYIEHFALDEQGSTPPFIDRQQYLAGIVWKRETHERYGTVLVETFSHEKRSGRLLSGLQAKLTALPGKALTIESISTPEALKRLEKEGRVDDFSKLTVSFLRHFKGSQISMEELRRSAVSASGGDRARAYVNVFEPIFDEYQQELRAAGEIDFEDMIALAADHVASGRFVSPYGYILVDEFQDISVGRAKLLKALLVQRPDNQLFAVGDDWQAIFRFAGSDISLIRDFRENFGVTARTYLEETFRCTDRICDIASKFIMCNEGQIAKKMKAVNKAAKPAVFIGRPSAKPGYDILGETLFRIVEHAGNQRVGVLLIGRYNHCRPRDLSEREAAFPSLSLRFRTAHGSKGLEDDYVVVLGLSTGRMGFPTGLVDDPLLGLVLADPERFPDAEERRLFYVALTRARRAVFLIADRTSPSAFVVELERGGYDVVNFGENPRSLKRCPVCKEGNLVVREGKNSSFVGCSFYPLCEHTEDTCPNCDSGIVRRDGDQFRCSNPECKDQPRMCPRCGRGWMQSRTRRDGTGDFFGCSAYPTCRHTEKI